MTSAPGKLAAFLLLFQFGCVISQSDPVQWNNDLPDLLTNTGLREDLPIGTKLGTLSVLVPTDVLHLLYSTNSSYFNVTERTGDVSLNAELSYRQMKSFDVIFFAKDLTKGQSFQKIVTVNVRGVNHPPFFDVPTYQVSLKDNVNIGTVFYNWIFITDVDTGPNGTVHLVCNPPANDPEVDQACLKFTVSLQQVAGNDDSYLGSVSTNSRLNYMNMSRYVLPLLAKDDGNPQLSATATLIVNIESQFDSRPVFVNSPLILSVNESTPSNTDLGSIQAKSGDPSKTAPLKLKVSEDQKHWFYLENTIFDQPTSIYSAKIRTYGNISRAALTSDQYSFKIAAVELFNGQESQVSSETTVQVNVKDVNSFRPTFASPSYEVSVTEGLGVGAVIPGLSMIVMDLDQSDNALFSIQVSNVAPSPVPEIFLVQPTSAQGSASVSLIANKPEYLRYDDPSKRKYTVTITAQETRTQERNFGSTTVTINVLSRNNNPPVFTRKEYLTSLVDNRPVGTLVTDQIQANDPDTGDAGRITYSILNGNDKSYFSIDPPTAKITLAQKISYNVTGMYVVLTILAVDGTGLNATATLRIQILDSQHVGPVFKPPSVDTIVLEGTTNLRPPVQFYASPLERDRIVSYRIVGGNQNLFTLEKVPPTNQTNPNDPQLYAVTMKTGVDYNDTPGGNGVFEVVVEATSSAPNPLSTNLTVRINVQDTNNHSPVFSPTTYKADITEITPGETSLVTVNATDDDAPNSNNSKIHYIIDSGSRDNFVVDYTTGLIKIASKPNLSIDRFGDQYNITVLAIDEGGPPRTGTATVYIHVKDSVYRSPTFPDQSYTYYVSENTSPGTTIGTLIARSPDRRAILFYSILPDSVTAKDKNGQPVTNSSGGLDYKTSFAVNNTGQNATITVIRRLSYDYTVRIDFQVQANVTNPDSNMTISPATVNVTVFILPIQTNPDTVTFLEPPSKFALIYIQNTVPPGTVLYDLSAFHVATSKPIIIYTYTALDPKTQGYITINNFTGEIVLVQNLVNLNLTLPMNITYVVTAIADPPSNASEKATIVISISDINANIPKFNQARYNFTIYNNVTLGNFVGKLDAKLPGSAPGQGQILYDLDGNWADAFYIDNNTGIIYVNKPDVVSSMNMFTLNGIASYGNSPKTFVVVNIYVIHFYNTKPPIFRGAPYTFYTLDKTPINSTIGQVLAFDPDIYHSSQITYSVTDGNGTEYFKLDPTTGAIQTKKPLLYNLQPYHLRITATSTGVPPQTTPIETVRIFVASVTDEMGFYVPETDLKLYYAYVNKPNDFVVRAQGYSTRPGANIVFSLTTPGYNGPSKFLIDPVTGNLTTNGTLDWDPANPSQTVVIWMTDTVNAPNQPISRRINITLASDQAPSFDLCTGLNATLLANVDEQQEPGANVIKVKACSLDKPPNDTDMIYQITDGNKPADCYKGLEPFVIDPNSGLITTKVKLLWNCTKQFKLNVTVTRRNGSKADTGATKQLIIKVIPTDSSGPSFDPNLPGSCKGVGTDIVDGILDFTPPRTAFIQMYAGDCDVPMYGQHTYSLDPTTIFFHVPGSQESMPNVPDAFTVDNITGDVKTNLSNYRKYSRGYFTMQIKATDDKNRSAVAVLTVFIVREGQRIKFVFAKTPSQLKPVAPNFVQTMNDDFLAKYNTQTSANGPVLGTHVDKNAYYYWNETDMCFQVVQRSGVPRVLSADEALNLFPPRSSVPFNWVMESLYKNYSVMGGGPQACYVKTTTHWWSGYWFLWWLLIALALFIFVLALILCILACCFWPIYTRGYLKNRPYIVLDEPPTTSPVSDFEWQESMHRIN